MIQFRSILMWFAIGLLIINLLVIDYKDLDFRDTIPAISLLLLILSIYFSNRYERRKQNKNQ